MRCHEIIDKMDNLNAILEVCHGYTQSECPDMKALDSTLYFLLLGYTEIFNELFEVPTEV